MSFAPRPSGRPLSERRGEWLPRFLFGLAVLAATGLISLVLFAPWLDNQQERPEGWSRLVGVFARDRAMRHTAIAGAVGLVVTACVFFRTPRQPLPPRPTTSSGPVIGA